MELENKPEGISPDSISPAKPAGIKAIQEASVIKAAPTWKDRFKNALKAALNAGLIGAGTGFIMGGPMGALLGAGAGAIGGGAFGATAGSEPTQEGKSTAQDDLFWGTPEGLQMLERFDPKQREELIRSLEEGTKNIQNPTTGFEAIKQNALNTFYGDVVPRLQTMFSASGTNAISSPVLQTNLSSAGGELASRLAAQEAQYGMANKQFGLQQQQLGLQPRYSGAQTTGGQTGLNERLLGTALPKIAETAVSRYFEPK